MKHPRCDDRGDIVVIKSTAEPEDVWGRYVLPHDHFLAKALFLTKSAQAHVAPPSCPPPVLTLLSFAGLS